MNAIHGGKTKTDKIDSYQIAKLLMGGNMPVIYPYPAKMRTTRDLLRRRTYLVRQRGLLLAHIQNTNTEYNLPSFEGKKISRKFNHETDPSRKRIRRQMGWQIQQKDRQRSPEMGRKNRGHDQSA